MTFFLCFEQYLSSFQGLPGPPGEKGENGDVGPMVSVSHSVTFLPYSDSYCFHVQPNEVGNCSDCPEFWLVAEFGNSTSHLACAFEVCARCIDTNFSAVPK